MAPEVPCWGVPWSHTLGWKEIRVWWELSARSWDQGGAQDGRGGGSALDVSSPGSRRNTPVHRRPLPLRHNWGLNGQLLSNNEKEANRERLGTRGMQASHLSPLALMACKFPSKSHVRRSSLSRNAWIMNKGGIEIHEQSKLYTYYSAFHNTREHPPDFFVS